MSSVQWPYSTFPPRKVTAELVAATLSAARDFTGIEDVGYGNGPFWLIVLDEIPLVSRQAKLSFRAVSARLEGRLNSISVPVYDVDGPKITGVSTVRDAAAAGATSLVIRVGLTDLVEFGHQFSLQGASTDDRLYRVINAAPGVPSGAHMDYAVVIGPALREDAAAGAAAEFAEPRCTCRLLSDNEMDSGTDDYAGRTLAKVTLIEWFADDTFPPLASAPTAAAPFPWPYKLLAPRRVTPEVQQVSGGGGRSLTEFEQVIISDAGYWQIVLNEIPLAGPAQRRVWHGISTLLHGRYGRCDVPIYDTDCAPWPLDGAGNPIKSYPDLPHSDGALFSDGSGYGQEVIIATSDSDTALGAVVADIRIVFGDALQPGQHFSVLCASGKTRLYRIKAITATVVDGSDVVYTVKLRPPVREAFPAGSILEFDASRLTCRLATDREMETGVDAYDGSTLALVNFVEHLP